MEEDRFTSCFSPPCALHLTVEDLRYAPCALLYAVCWFGESTPEQLKGEGDGDFNIQKISEIIKQRPDRTSPHKYLVRLRALYHFLSSG